MDTTINYIKSVWEHQGFQKYFRNTGWMISARTISFLTSFLTISIVARYLGPENLGKLEYAQSFVAIISVFASLGIDQILYRDLILEKEKEEELLGTAIYSKILLGILAFFISISISILIGDSIIVTLLIGICALTFIINPLGTVGILFNAEVKSKYSSQITIFLAFFIPLIKILIIFLNKGIIFFATILFLETLISTSWSIYIYIKKFKGKPLKWKLNLNVFKKLMKESWPLLLASFSGYIYAKMDQVMLMHYINSESVGLYSVAVKLTQVWAFIPGLVIISLFPAIVNAKKDGVKKYARRFRLLTVFTLSISFLIATPLYIFAPIVIKTVFGNDFVNSAPILQIYLWVSITTTLIILTQQFLIAEKLSKIFLYTSIIGAVLNIFLNILLIPNFGSQGAAYATLISYFSVFISTLFFKKSRSVILEIIILKK